MPNKFWDMPGEVYKHYYQDETNSLSDNIIYELRNKNGLTSWFGKDVLKEVCLTGQCRLVHIWIFWDCKGDYLGFELHKNEPLTKTDHVFFSEEDYLRLDQILTDTASILKSLNIEDLTIEEKMSNSQNIDGVTSATQPSLNSYAVKDAIFTCYTLWHTVYGPIQKKIKQIVDEKVDSSYIDLLLQQRDSRYLSLAIDYIRKNPNYQPMFIKNIVPLLAVEDDNISNEAFVLLKTNQNWLFNQELQKLVIHKISDVSPYVKYEIIRAFSNFDDYINEQVVIAFLTDIKNQKIAIGALDLVYKMIDKEHLCNDVIVTLIKENLDHKDPYVRNITIKLLE